MQGNKWLAGLHRKEGKKKRTAGTNLDMRATTSFLLACTPSPVVQGQRLNTQPSQKLNTMLLMWTYLVQNIFLPQRAF